MTGIPGVDAAWNKPTVAALKAAGEIFFAGYFSNDPTKNLTPKLVAGLLAAKIDVVAVWEYSATAMRGGKPQGQQDASRAETEARACGVDGIPVYFACDYDAPPGDQGAIDSYLDGCASVIGHARVGMYGGYWPLSRGRAAGKAAYYWGTPAWSGNEWAISGFTPHIMQGGLVTIGGVQCDLDAGLSTDFGQWPRPGTVTTWQAWHSDGSTSLAALASQTGLWVSHILAATATKYQRYDPVFSAYASAGEWETPIPAGATLWVRK